MPTLDLSELNVVASVMGGFAMLFGLAAVQIKSRLFLGEALPAVLVGAVLGPAAARLLDVQRWVDATATRQDDITMGVMRIMIGIQLVIAGYQLPARYLRGRWRELLVCLVPVMTLMWLATSACVLAALPGLGPLPALIIGACVTSTDPILSQAIAKGPFADKFVARALREVISAEAGANDGFASPFLGLALTLLLQRRPAADGAAAPAAARALRAWLLETLLYTVFLALAYGALAGYLARKAVGLSLARKWIDSESYLLFPCSLGLFILGTCGALGTSDLLACFTAGCALNWDGQFLAETQRRHDDFNSCIDVLLNLAGFGYIGMTVPWAAFGPGPHAVVPGPRLLALGLLVLVFRRIPAMLACYRLMPAVVPGWRDAVFMGYFGPIGVGAIYYLEHTRLLLLRLPHRTPAEERLLQTMGPVVYFLALFSILVHGLSIPVLNTAYWLYGVRPLTGDAETIRRRSVHVALPPNAIRADADTFIAFNRFPRPTVPAADAAALPTFHHSSRAPDKENGGASSSSTSTSTSTSLRSVVVDVGETGEERHVSKCNS